jgi:hypothetical protein
VAWTSLSSSTATLAWTNPSCPSFSDRSVTESCPSRFQTSHKINVNKKEWINNFGDYYCTYPALLGGSRRWENEKSVLPGVI